MSDLSELVSSAHDPSRDVIIYSVAGKEVGEVSRRILTELSLTVEEYFDLYIRGRYEARSKQGT